MWKTNKTEEQLLNRILINFGIGILAYMVLNMLHSNWNMDNAVVFPVAGVCAVAAVVLYIVSAKTGKYRNYAHMFVAFTLALLFTRLAYFTYLIFGGQVVMNIVNSGYFWKSVMNTQKEVMFVSILGGVYLVGMLIYNVILIAKVRKAKKKK